MFRVLGRPNAILLKRQNSLYSAFGSTYSYGFRFCSQKSDNDTTEKEANSSPDSTARKLQIAVVGSGPSGCFVASYLTKKNENIHVDIYERLPVPFGLCRYGVAPDHPDVKNVEDQFMELFKSGKVTWIGNVEVGKHIPIAALLEHYAAVVISTGAEGSKSLGIEGEGLGNVLNVRDFVSYYNTYPFPVGSPRFCPFDLRKTEKVTIIGNGNVAMDAARVLAADYKYFCETDMNAVAIKELMQNRIREVNLIARRGVESSAFAIAEFREMTKYQPETVTVQVDPFDLEKALAKKGYAQTERAHKRLMELVHKFTMDEKAMKEELARYACNRNGELVHADGALRSLAEIKEKTQSFVETAGQNAKEWKEDAEPYVDTLKRTTEPYMEKMKEKINSPYIDSLRSKAEELQKSSMSYKERAQALLKEAEEKSAKARRRGKELHQSVTQQVQEAKKAAEPYVESATPYLERAKEEMREKTGQLTQNLGESFHSAKESVETQLQPKKVSSTARGPCTVRFRYNLKPIRFLPSRNPLRRNHVGAVLYERTDVPPTAPETERYVVEPCDVVLKSIGYRSEMVKGVPFDEERGVVPNERGRVEGQPRLYCSGWIKNGAKGVILHSVVDAQETVQSILQDIEKKVIPTEGVDEGEGKEKKGPTMYGKYGLVDYFVAKKLEPVSIKGLERIFYVEKERGADLGKRLEKMDSVRDMLDVALGGDVGKKTNERVRGITPARPEAMMYLKELLDDDTDLAPLARELAREVPYKMAERHPLGRIGPSQL